MSEQQLTLIQKAEQKYGAISPCSNHSVWQDCFSTYGGKLYFWFNDKNNSTRVESDEIEQQVHD